MSEKSSIFGRTHPPKDAATSIYHIGHYTFKKYTYKNKVDIILFTPYNVSVFSHMTQLVTNVTSELGHLII